MKEKRETNEFAEEREALHKQFELLAERSKNVNLEITELVALSEQMIAIHRALHL